MGYAGGLTSDPNYHDLGGHAEVVQIEFDSAQIGFTTLLDLFWESHDPTRHQPGSQYRSILICTDEVQLRVARDSAIALENKLGRKVQTQIICDKEFHIAEKYHQKWKLRRHKKLWDQFANSSEKEDEFLLSVAATKLNAIAGGHLSQAQITEFREQTDLSDIGTQLLESLSSRAQRVLG